MQHYKIEHIINNHEWEEKLTELAQRCEDINGWTENDLLQFAVKTMPMYKVWLMYIDDIVHEFEQEKINKRWWNKVKKNEGNKWE